MNTDPEKILDEIIQLTEAHKTVAPRDIALTLVQKYGDPEKDDWRKILPNIKKVAKEAALANEIHFWRKGKIVSPEGVRGVFRLMRATKESLAELNNPES
ncbi:DUF3253 domain-containing protein [Temperatibacter marinus]|uniref:DUF3253 domain-containing protein n=1 Tax=Temperatibacter marinus TaxID=1456591 RepID=A0AA52EKW6_9PROT|nr:DUF3253 domain-containing protein [Temperatibacter marinus]WND04124.1 DUF3253 domain-containing protein [Temperatibacter marinus]